MKAKKLSPHHHSMRGERRSPLGFSRAVLSRDQAEFCEQIAIDILGDMTMNGFTFVEALAAIYFTGIEHGASGARDT